MCLSLLRRILLASAAMLTVTGGFPLFDGSDGPQATFFEIEDAEEDEREHLSARVAVSVAMELALHETIVDWTPAPPAVFFVGPQSERGPPAA